MMMMKIDFAITLDLMGPFLLSTSDSVIDHDEFHFRTCIHTLL